MIKVSKEEYYNAVCAQLPELDYKMGLSTCMGDADFYLELLNDFSELPIKDELERFFKEEDAHNYCIKVHGFKNNAYSVGAREIGDLAYELEKITKTGSFDGALEVQTHMFELYDSVCRRYSDITVISQQKIFKKTCIELFVRKVKENTNDFLLYNYSDIVYGKPGVFGVYL